MSDTQGTVIIGGCNITNLRFAEDIESLVGKEELVSQVENLHEKSKYVIEM